MNQKEKEKTEEYINLTRMVFKEAWLFFLICICLLNVQFNLKNISIKSKVWILKFIQSIYDEKKLYF